MDYTDTLNSLKKEIFNVEFKIRMSQNDRDNLHALLRERYILKQKYELIMMESMTADGQIGFGFADQIDVSQIGKGK